MAYLSGQKTTKVTLPSDSNYWAVVKVGLKYGELKKFYEYGGTQGSLTTPEKLKLCLVEWNLDDEKGEVLPITIESFDLLQEEDVIAIADAATPKADKQVKKN